MVAAIGWPGDGANQVNRTKATTISLLNPIERMRNWRHSFWHFNPWMRHMLPLLLLLLNIFFRRWHYGVIRYSHTSIHCRAARYQLLLLSLLPNKFLFSSNCFAGRTDIRFTPHQSDSFPNWSIFGIDLFHCTLAFWSQIVVRNQRKEKNRRKSTKKWFCVDWFAFRVNWLQPIALAAVSWNQLRLFVISVYHIRYAQVRFRWHFLNKNLIWMGQNSDWICRSKVYRETWMGSSWWWSWCRWHFRLCAGKISFRNFNSTASTIHSVSFHRKPLVTLYSLNCPMLAKQSRKVVNAVHWKVWKRPVNYIHRYRAQWQRKIRPSKIRPVSSIHRATTKDGYSKWSSRKRPKSTRWWPKRNIRNSWRDIKQVHARSHTAGLSHRSRNEQPKPYTMSLSHSIGVHLVSRA